MSCPVQADTRREGFVACDLIEGHDGLHYDELYQVSWKEGGPGGDDG